MPSFHMLYGHRPYRIASYFSFMEGMDATVITISTPHRDLEGLKTSMEKTTRVGVLLLEKLYREKTKRTHMRGRNLIPAYRELWPSDTS